MAHKSKKMQKKSQKKHKKQNRNLKAQKTGSVDSKSMKTLAPVAVVNRPAVDRKLMFGVNNLEDYILGAGATVGALGTSIAHSNMKKHKAHRKKLGLLYRNLADEVFKTDQLNRSIDRVKSGLSRESKNTENTKDMLLRKMDYKIQRIMNDPGII